MKSVILFLICISFAFGVFIRSYFDINQYFYFTILFVGIIFLAFFFLNRKKRIFLLSSFSLMFIFLGIFRMDMADKDIRNMNLYKYNNQTIVVSGIVVSIPETKGDTKKFEYSIDHIDNKEIKKEKVLISIVEYEDIKYGDRIKVLGKISTPSSFVNEIGKEFDYESYLKKDNIYFLMKGVEIEIQSHNNGYKILNFLYKIREKVLEKINRNIQSPESLLGAGIILGVKDGMGKKLEDDFIKTGTIHIVALSGYNVTIVADWLIKILSIFLSITTSLYIGIVGIISFALMTGAGSTVIRASIMAILVLVGRILGREYSVWRGLLSALVIMVMINPWILVYDVSFQLSFIATIGIIYFSPIFFSKLKFLTLKFGIRSIVADTLGTYIFVLPFIVYIMGNLSFVAIFANIAIVPFVPLAMLLVFVTVSVSFLVPFAGIFFGLISYLLLHYQISTVKFFANLPFASLTIKTIPIILVVFIYLIFIYLILKFKRRDSYLVAER